SAEIDASQVLGVVCFDEWGCDRRHAGRRTAGNVLAMPTPTCIERSILGGVVGRSLVLEGVVQSTPIVGAVLVVAEFEVAVPHNHILRERRATGIARRWRKGCRGQLIDPVVAGR